MEERVIVCFLGISQLSVLCPFEWGQHIGETLNSATKLKAMDYFWVLIFLSVDQTKNKENESITFTKTNNIVCHFFGILRQLILIATGPKESVKLYCYF